MTTPCVQEEEIGKIKEFIESTKGTRVSIVAIVFTIIIQVISFAFLWGGITTTVNKDNSYLWGDITVISRDNTRNIDKILAKFELIQVIQGVKGDKGDKGDK